jgi:hypothetical protein
VASDSEEKMMSGVEHEEEFDVTQSLQERGERLSQESYVGCGVYRFEKTGRTELESLIRNGLNPWSKLLDIGCGALCGGYWMIHFLNSGCYHGLEPNEHMFKAGVKHILEPGLLQDKKPSFQHNDQYDFSGFGTRFDYFHAHSIWTHAPKKDIEKMLDGFLEFGNDGARFLIKAPRLFRPDYKGDTWVGISHESDKPGICRHSMKWIQQACSSRGITVRMLKNEKIHKQKWILIEK